MICTALAFDAGPVYEKIIGLLETFGQSRDAAVIPEGKKGKGKRGQAKKMRQLNHILILVMFVGVSLMGSHTKILIS